jgi:hypothetical protein
MNVRFCRGQGRVYITAALGTVGRSATIDVGMSVTDSKVLLPASVERKDHDVKEAVTGAPAQLTRCGA